MCVNHCRPRERGQWNEDGRENFVYVERYELETSAICMNVDSG
jgi:hypothetical protein